MEVVVSFTPDLFISREGTAVTYWIGGCVGTRIGLDAVEKRKVLTLPGIEP
jgi:hypothetical protein